MSKYRIMVGELFPDDPSVESVVGCALDRLNRTVTVDELHQAVQLYKTNHDEWLSLKYNIGVRRDLVANHIIEMAS